MDKQKTVDPNKKTNNTNHLTHMFKYLVMAAFAFTAPIMGQEATDTKPACDKTTCDKPECGKKDGGKHKKRDGKRQGTGKKGQGHKHQKDGQKSESTPATPAEA